MKRWLLVLCVLMLFPIGNSWADDDIEISFWSDPMVAGGQSILYAPWFIERGNALKSFLVLANVSALTDTLTIDLFTKGGGQVTKTVELAPMVPLIFRPSSVLGSNVSGMARITGTEIVGVTVRQLIVGDDD